MTDRLCKDCQHFLAHPHASGDQKFSLARCRALGPHERARARLLIRGPAPDHNEDYPLCESVRLGQDCGPEGKLWQSRATVVVEAQP